MKIGPFYIEKAHTNTARADRVVSKVWIRSPASEEVTELGVGTEDYEQIRRHLEQSDGLAVLYLVTDKPPPTPMLLWCPACGERHIDAGAFTHHPHHTHACQACGMVWRPAIVQTVGVDFLPGFKD